MVPPIVATKSGKVKGKFVELKDGKKVQVFRNIPFAKPPVGPLRFMPPEPADSWDGIKDATKAGNMPMYDSSADEMFDKIFPMVEPDDSPRVHDEDCLHVSVYAPVSSAKKLPVMMWLYGGGFSMGCERPYDGSVLAGMNDVVVVVPNYRVGVFGFLSFGPDSVCSGNAGLLDQQQALRWVQENIEQFGGDKDNVTIFGESAGSASVHFHVLSPSSRNLFHKAISHSGQEWIAAPYMTADLRSRVKDAIVKKCVAEAKNDKEALLGLQKIPAKELMDACNALIMENVYCAPTIDGKVLPRSTSDLLKEKNFAKVPYIIGCNNSEGKGLLAMTRGESFATGFTEDEAKAALAMPITDEGYAICKKRYLREEDGELKHSKFIGELNGDGMLVSGAIAAAKHHSEAGADVYCYLGEFQLKMHHDDKFGDVTKKPDWCECDHGDDIYMTFGAPFSPVEFPRGVKFSEEEQKLSKAFMTYLTNFAKTGNPNKGEPVDFQWPKYKPGGEHLCVVSPLSTKKNFGEDVMKFWMDDMKPYFKPT